MRAAAPKLYGDFSAKKGGSGDDRARPVRRIEMIRTHYLDASAIVKMFANETDSELLRQYVDAHSVFYAFTPCFIEAMSILKGKVRRGEFATADAYHAACEDLVAWVRDDGLMLEGAVITDRDSFVKAEALAIKHSIDLIDAYQVWVVKVGFLSRFAGTPSAPLLITADGQLATAARDENISVWDCVREPVPTA